MYLEDALESGLDVVLRRLLEIQNFDLVSSTFDVENFGAVLGAGMSWREDGADRR